MKIKVNIFKIFKIKSRDRNNSCELKNVSSFKENFIPNVESKFVNPMLSGSEKSFQSGISHVESVEIDIDKIPGPDGRILREQAFSLGRKQEGRFCVG